MYGQKRTGNDYRAERTKRLQQYNPEEKAGKSESDIQCPKGRNSAHQSKAVGNGEQTKKGDEFVPLSISDKTSHKQRTPLQLKLFDLLLNELRRYTKLRSEAVTAEVAGTASSKKFPCGADIIEAKRLFAACTESH